jgi:hypothetical protein
MGSKKGRFQRYPADHHIERRASPDELPDKGQTRPEMVRFAVPNLNLG